MSAILRRQPRLFSVISRNNRRFSSNATADPPKEPIISSSTILSDQPPPSDASTPKPPPAGAEKKPWSFLKYSLIAALTGGVATAGYATYAELSSSAAYSLDEVDQKTRDFRAAANYTVGDDAPAFDDYTEPLSDKLLPDLHPMEQHVITLVLDLNETLVYSDWKRDRGWRTFKRPGVDAFLEHLAQFYEIVVYSDQQSMYVDPVIERLDPKHCIRYRLSRGATKYLNGKHYRDLSMLNRDPSKVIYISGHALESSLQPENCLEIKPWTGETEDTALLDLIPFLEYVGKHRPGDIRAVLASYQGRDVAKEFIERSKEHQRFGIFIVPCVKKELSTYYSVIFSFPEMNPSVPASSLSNYIFRDASELNLMDVIGNGAGECKNKSSRVVSGAARCKDWLTVGLYTLFETMNNNYYYCEVVATNFV
nr:mitochondrial import inner membrane translocase subunit TIM50 [Ipomoea trifida]